MTDLTSLVSIESAGILTAAAALSAAVVRAWPVIRRLARFLDDVQGEPARPGSPARPGWGERLQAIESRLVRVEDTAERVRAQTENSHVTNLRDDLDDVAAKVTDLHQRHASPRRKARP